MYQNTLTATTHSPDGDPIHVSSYSTSEGEGIIRTGGGSCSELSSNIIWKETNKNGVSIVVHPGKRDI